MRIAVYHNLSSGGAKRALLEMTKRLATRHEISVYTLSTADHDFCDLRPFSTRHVVIPFRTLPLARRPFGRLNQGIRTADLLRLESIQRRIAAQIDGGGYDVVFVHNCRFSQSPGLLKFLRTPSVYYCQEPPRLIHEPPISRPYHRYSPIQRVGNLVDPFPMFYRGTLARLDRANVHAATRILVNSHYSRETVYRTYGMFAQVGRLGVDSSLFYPQWLERQPYVLSVGALTPAKGFDWLIRSLGLMGATERPALTIISNAVNPPELDFLQTLALSERVTVDFRAGVTDSELTRAYNQALLTLYAPVMEPFGFVPLESMACGTPVVGVNEAGVRESVRHNETGLLVEREPAAFARAITDLLADQDRREELGRRGRDYVERAWSWKQSVQAIERHLITTAEDRQ